MDSHKDLPPLESMLMQQSTARLQRVHELEAEVAALKERLEAAHKLIDDHNAGCIASCEAIKGPRHCDAYLGRGRAACPECPRDWMIDDAALARGGVQVSDSGWADRYDI